MSLYGSLVSGAHPSNDKATWKNLMPSPNSTDGSVLNGDQNNHDEVETYQNGVSEESIQLLPLKRQVTFHEMIQEHVTGPHVRSRSLLWLSAVAAIASSAVWFTKSYHHGGDWSTDKESSGLSAFGNKRDPRAPFSTLDPVKDLGLEDFDRPKGSKPARVVTDGSSRKNYPTNSWYQSLLMPAGEPDMTHRAYAIPYIVDAAGPMPGLRIHANHIDASSSVVQLYVIEEYGLTLGAAADASLAQTTKGDNGTAKPESRQYTVTHTTPLGVTLAWVSGILVCSIFCFSQKERLTNSANTRLFPELISDAFVSHQGNAVRHDAVRNDSKDWAP
jgi:hypothetical protein